MQAISSKTERRRYWKSSSFVIALLFTLLCAATALIIGYTTSYKNDQLFRQTMGELLTAEARYVEAVGVQAARTRNPTMIYRPAETAHGLIDLDEDEAGKDYVAAAFELNNGETWLIGREITDARADLNLMQWLGFLSIGFVLLVVIGSYMISIFVVSGTNRIADTAREIVDTGDLSRRVEVGAQWDDLSNTAGVLNMFLGRVQELMQGVRQVSDNIAHDLRTPLTRLRSNLEALEDSDRKEQLLDEADHLLSTFNALLRISRIESERQRSQFRQVDLKALLEDVAAFYEPLTEDKQIAVSSDLSEANVKGDRDLLFQTFANIMDNAVKFTPRAGRIDIGMTHSHGRVQVFIRDTGPGLSAADQEKVFERFYRGETSRSSEGTGLGLSLVRAVVGLHGGEITVRNRQPGLSVITTL